MKTAHLAEELEWQLKLGVGYHQAMRAVGYTKPASLARQLQRLGRKDLAKHYEP